MTLNLALTIRFPYGYLVFCINLEYSSPSANFHNGFQIHLTVELLNRLFGI